MDVRDLRKRLADPATRNLAAIEVGDYFRDLCLIMGTELKTASKVGAVVAIGLDKEWSKDDG